MVAFTVEAGPLGLTLSLVQDAGLVQDHVHALRDCLCFSEVRLVVKLPSEVYESLGISGGIISSNLSNIIQLKMLESVVKCQHI